jgi:hypothetical protein
MINLLPHYRVHIPNSLAIAAALVLVISSVVGFKANQEVFTSGQESTHSVKTNNSETSNISDSVEPKSRGLNIGSLLFRRG